MSQGLLYAAAVACLVTLVIVMIGIVGFGSGRASSSFSNRIMRYRIVAQAVAIVLIVLTVYAAKTFG